MRVVSFSTRNFRSRTAQLIALSSVIAIAACNDVTAPDGAEAAAPELVAAQSATLSDLKYLSAGLDDMTGWSLITLGEGEARTNIVGILNGLKGHLASGKIAACQDDVTQGRAWFASLTEAEQSEQGNIGVTLDLIQSVLDQASQ
jgi:hypothetical protein